MSDLPIFLNTNPTLWLGKTNQTERPLAEMSSSELASKKSLNIKEVCKDFESLFLNYLLKEMRATIPKSSLFGGSSAEKIYTSLFDEELSKNLAQNGGIGLAKTIENHLSKNLNNNKKNML